MPSPQRHREVASVLRNNGWHVLRNGKGSHQIWVCAEGTTRMTIPSGPEVCGAAINDLKKLGLVLPAHWFC